jgi:hypothetical protein
MSHRVVLSHAEESRFPSRRFAPQDDAGRLEASKDYSN